MTKEEIDEMQQLYAEASLTAVNLLSGKMIRNCKQLCELALDGLRWREQAKIITNPTGKGVEYYRRQFVDYDPALAETLVNGDWEIKD